MLGSSERDNALILSVTNSTRLYLASFFIGATLPMVNRIQNALISPDQPVYALYVAHAVTDSLQGFFNACAYFFSRFAFVFRLVWLN